MARERSTSQLLSYSRCGLAYRLERIDKVDQLPAAWSIQGTAFHKAAEAYERSGRRMTFQEAQEVFITTWNAEIARAKAVQPNLSKWMRGGRKSTEKDIDERYLAGLGQVADYVKVATMDTLEPVELPDGSPATEVGFGTEIGGVRVQGFIDLVLYDPETNSHIVRDLKTGAKPPFTPTQLKVYQRGLLDTLGIHARWGDFYMAREAEPTAPIDLDAFISDEVLERWFLDMHEMESQGRYLPNPSADNCWACAVKHHCPIMSNQA